MIRLSNTTKKLQAVLGGAITTSQPQAVVSFYDENNAGEQTRGADQETNLNSTTDVDICNALGTGKESYTRNIDTLTIYNRDTVSATVTVKIDDGGTESILVKATLSTLETLSYDHESGWKVTTSAGATKMAQASMGIDDLSDVTITSAANGNVLYYNGTAWVNQSASSSGASWVLISTATASSSASVEFTSGINSTYDTYVVVASNVVPATDTANFLVTLSQNSGSTYLSASYHYASWAVNDAGSSGAGASASASSIQMFGSMENTTGQGGAFTLHLNNPSTSSSFKTINFHGGYQASTGQLNTVFGSGQYQGDGNAINGIKFAMSSGNIATGNFALYGIRKT